MRKNNLYIVKMFLTYIIRELHFRIFSYKIRNIRIIGFISSEINNKHTMSTIRKFEFNKSHEIMFGLKIASKDPQTNKVTSVKCMFCIYFGKDNDLKDRKRKSTTKVKYFVYPSFRTDNYRSHLKLHKYKWEEY